MRFFRLFQLPRAASPASKATTCDIGALFVSERCQEVDYQRSHAAFDGLEEQRHVEDEDEAAMIHADDGDASESLTVFSMTDQRCVPCARVCGEYRSPFLLTHACMTTAS